MTRGKRLAEILKKKMLEKPYDDYILIDKNLLWKIIVELERNDPVLGNCGTVKRDIEVSSY